EDITRRSATDALIREFKLSPEEAERRLPSEGATYIRNRVGWAMSFLTKGGLIEKVAQKKYRATEAGKEFLRNHPHAMLVAELEPIPRWEEAWNTKAKKREAAGSAATEAPLETTSTPYERIETAFSELRETLIADLQSQVAKVDPFRFEQVVLDLL